MQKSHLLKFVLVFFLILFSPAVQYVSALSFSHNFGPLIYTFINPEADSSGSTGTLSVQQGMASSLELSAGVPFTSDLVDFVAGGGYLFTSGTRITILEFVKGFQSLYLNAGLRIKLNEDTYLSGLVFFNNSIYENTKTSFAHISAMLRPEFKLLVSDNQVSSQVLYLITPVYYDFRKDAEPALGFSVGLAVEIFRQKGDAL
ncbi:MAG: hypothetical protein K9L21_02690 [Spirochaetia bacterium]|nr:hypothetical protein [Spirochaetia bacterium]